MSEHRELSLPMTAQAAHALRVGDTVRITGDITVSIGLPAHRRMAELAARGDPLPVDLRDGAFLHLSTCVRETPDGIVPLYLNPSTSTRYDAWMPSIVRAFRPRLVGGKGGLDSASVQALRDVGCVYLSFLGGGLPLLSRALRSVVASHWNEYISQFRLTTLSVESMGPATVAIDAHGHSLYDELRAEAQRRMPAIVERLAQARR